MSVAIAVRPVMGSRCGRAPKWSEGIASDLSPRPRPLEPTRCASPTHPSGRSAGPSPSGSNRSRRRARRRDNRRRTVGGPHRRVRRTATGASRGLHCGMGACFDCVVTVDSRIGQRACMTKVADGMTVAVEPVVPLAPLGHEPDRAQAEDQGCDLLVVGAGPAGIITFIAAGQAGATVVVLDERSATGGQYAKSLADSHADAAPDPQFRLGVTGRGHPPGRRSRPRQSRPRRWPRSRCAHRRSWRDRAT